MKYNVRLPKTKNDGLLAGQLCSGITLDSARAKVGDLISDSGGVSNRFHIPKCIEMHFAGVLCVDVAPPSFQEHAQSAREFRLPCMFEECLQMALHEFQCKLVRRLQDQPMSCGIVWLNG